VAGGKSALPPGYSNSCPDTSTSKASLGQILELHMEDRFPSSSRNLIQHGRLFTAGFGLGAMGWATLFALL